MMITEFGRKAAIALALLGAAISVPGAAMAASPAPAAATLAGYAGTYKLPPFEMTVTAEDGKLFASPQGRPKLELTAAGQDRFAAAAVGAEISFTRDTAGAVTGLTLAQRGQEISGPKTR